jgi:hypothetical protein
MYEVARPIYACKQFEISYANLIDKVMSCQFGTVAPVA